MITHWVASVDARDREGSETGCSVKVAIVIGYGEGISTIPDVVDCELCVEFLALAEEYANSKVYGE